MLKDSTTLEVQNRQLNEECPSCRAFITDTLRNRGRLSPFPLEQEQMTGITNESLQHLSIEFQTAFQQVEKNNTGRAHKRDNQG